MFDRIKEFVGNLWGQTTTQALAFLVMIQPVLMQIDPSLLADYPTLRWAIFLVSLAVVILRFFAPPPPAVTIKPEDAVTKMNANTVVITKPDPLPAHVVDQDPGKAA